MSDNDKVTSNKKNNSKEIPHFEPIPFEKPSKEKQLIFLQEKIW